MHINGDGIVTEVQFDNDTSEDEDFKIAAAENQRCTTHSKKNTTSEQTTSFLTKMKKLFRRK